jgi:hypothetical protein
MHEMKHVYLGTLHISMSGANQGYIDLKDCLNSVVGTGTVEGKGFGCTPRKLVWTTNFGTDGGDKLGVSITETPNAALTADTADKLSTNVGESTIHGLTPQQRYFNWCLIGGINGTTLAVGGGGADDLISVEGYG